MKNKLDGIYEEFYKNGQLHIKKNYKNNSSSFKFWIWYIIFFKECRKVLTEYGHEDAAFYFEQVEEHLRNGGSLASKDVGRILGV